MKSTQYQPKTGQACSCKPGKQRDNCTRCEGTGSVIDFAAIRNKKEPTEPQPEPLAGSYRTADGKAQIEWTLEQGENGLKFSASGTYGGGSGQCVDSIAKAYPNDATIQRIAKVWALYHLNDMKAGTPEQHAEIERAQVEAVNHVRGLADGKKYFYDAEMTQPNWHYLPSVFGFDSYFDWECATLRRVGLYEVQIKPGMKATGGFPPEVVAGKRGYHFGERWIFSEIPADVVNEIKSWRGLQLGEGHALWFACLVTTKRLREVSRAEVDSKHARKDRTTERTVRRMLSDKPTIQRDNIIARNLREILSAAREGKAVKP